MLREHVFKYPGVFPRDIELFIAFVYKYGVLVFSFISFPQPLLRRLRVNLMVGKHSDRFQHLFVVYHGFLSFAI